MTTENEIRNLIMRWADAIAAEDVDGIVARHAPDILMFDVPPPLQLRGLETYKESWAPFFASFEGRPIRFEVTDLDVHVGGDVAFATALVHCRAANADGNEPNVRLTVGLRKLAGEWTIIHEHHSVPTA